MNDEEKAKKCRNAEYNEDKKNDDKKDSTEVNDESDNGKNATKEVHTDESDEKTENTTVNDAKIDENETKINIMDKNTKVKKKVEYEDIFENSDKVKDTENDERR